MRQRRLLVGLLAASLAPAARASVEDQRVAVVIGHDRGTAWEERLSYAEADATRFRQLLVEVGGVAPERALLVVGGDAARVRAALAEAVARVQGLELQGPTAFIVYVSGHADREALHLADERLPIAEIEQALADSRAGLKLAIVDACRTPVVAREKGGRTGPEVALGLDRRAAVEGAVLLTSAGEGEPAQEWARLRGSLFTHHLIGGLRGLADLDGNGWVSLAEAYTHAFNKTVSGSVASGSGPQHPSFELDVRGWGEWRFTRPAALGARIVIGPEVEGTLWAIDARDDVTAEVAKTRGESVSLAVKPGAYRIVTPDGAFARAVDVDIRAGDAHSVDPSQFVRVPAARAQLRGGRPLSARPWAVRIGVAGQSGLVQGAGLALAPALALTRSIGSWSLRARVAAARARFPGDGLEVRQHQLDAAIAGGPRFELGVTTLVLRAEAGAAIVAQTFTRSDETTRRLFGRPDPPVRALVPEMGVSAEFAAPLVGHLGLVFDAGAGVAWVPRLGGDRTPTPRLHLGAGITWSF